MEERLYYTLTFRRGDFIHRKGEVVKNDDTPLTVGQKEGCELILPKSESFEDVNYFTIVKNENDSDWRLVRQNDAVQIFINGERLYYIHYLEDKDSISIDGQQCELVFNIRKDTGYEGKKIEIVLASINRRIFTVVAACAVLVLGILGLWNLFENKNVVVEDISEESIFKIRLEKVILQQVTQTDGQVSVENLYMLDMNEAGTGFLTENGMFVTARHCIAPWIDENPNDTSSLLVKLALEAENSLGLGKSYKRLISKGSVYSVATDGSREEHKKFSFSSDTCLFVTENDFIENIGTVRNPIYWRSLGHTGKISSIGDIVCFKVPFTGNLKIADSKKMGSLKKNRRVGIDGIPGGSIVHAFYEGELSDAPVTYNGRIVRCIELVGDEVEKGLSGGPVMIKEFGRLYVVGVVSNRSISNSEKIFAAPITEVENLKFRQWEE